MNQDTSTRRVCPRCGELLDADVDNFCQACGADVSAASTPVEVAAAPPQEEKPRPWFPLVVLVWLLIMAAAFYFIYARAFVVGSA
jgi:hypothetical protein